MKHSASEVLTAFVSSSVLVADRDEQSLAEDGLTAGSDGAARSRASINAPISPPPEFQPEVLAVLVASCGLVADNGEQIVEEVHMAGGSHGDARPKVSPNASIFAAASEPPEEINNENEAASLQPRQTSASHQHTPRRPD